MFVPKRKFFILLGTLGVFVFSLSALIYHQQSIADFVFARHNGVTAALTGVTLNNGNGNVITGSDVTSQTTALSPDIGAYNWTIDGNRLMVLNMPFDSSVTSQSDLSGGTNAGAVNGATPTNAGCQVGSCMTFDGNDYIAIPNSADWNFTDTITISLWANRTLNNPMAAMGVGGSNYTSLIWLSGDGTFDSAGIYIHTTSSTEYSVGCTTAFGGLWNGSWQHVVGVYNRALPSNQLQFYVNGALCGSATVANEALLGVGGNGVDIGRWPQATSYLTGKLDEVQIYGRALSAAQITQLYQDGLAGLGGPTIIQSEETAVGQLWDLSIRPVTTTGSIGSATTSSNQVLIVSTASNITGTLDNPNEANPIISSLSIPGGSTAGYRWVVNGTNFNVLNIPFNSGATQTDISGLSNNGTVSQAVFTTGGCKVGNCFSFDGLNDSVLIGTATSARIDSGGVTLEAWIKPERLNNYIFGRPWDNHSSGNYSLFTTDGRLTFAYFGIGGSFNNYVSDSAMTLNEWHHVVSTHTFGTASSARLYIDGVLAPGAWTSGGGTALPDTASCACTLSIGHWFGTPDSTNDQYRFDGFIDEVKIYARQLNSIQIAQNYADGNAGLGTPTRIFPQEHAFGQTWELRAREFLSDGSVGPEGFIDNATITAAVATTIVSVTPSGTQALGITIAYTCSNADNEARDLLAEYSVNGGVSYASASLNSTTSGSISGSTILEATCDGSLQSVVWNSLTDNVALGVSNTDVRVRLTAQLAAAPSGETANFTVANPTNLCTAGGEAVGGLTAAETSFDGTNVLISGCTLSIDGAHTFTSLTIGNDVGTNDSILTQTATTTTVVSRTTITVSGATVINTDGAINMDEKGFLAGYISNGAGGLTTVGAAGDRSGGSHGGRGGTDSVGDDSPVPYDSISTPVDPGSGGGPQSGSGNGGGVIILSTGHFSHSGVISANGKRSTTASTGSGAGGTVRITTTGSVAGTGTIRANGASASTGGGAGGGGRIAVIYNSSISGNDTLEYTFQAFGGIEDGGVTDRRGGAGTVYLEKTNVHVANQGDLIIANNNAVITVTRITPIPTLSTFADVTIKDRAIAQAATLSVANLTLQNSATLQHDFATTTTVFRLNITATNTISIDSTSSMNVLGRGFVAGYTTNGVGGTTNVGGTTDRSGGSHGGRGGTDSVIDESITPYDSITQPADPGAGSGPQSSAGSGGGYVKITTPNLTLNGTINSNGLAGANGAGAGGGVWIIATGQITGAGTVSANGAVAGGTDDGSGGGGRIALHYNSSVSGNDPLPITLQAFGGNNTGSTDFRGGAGTVYLERTNAHTLNQGEIIVANNSVTVTEVRSAPIPDGTYDTLRVLNNGNVRNTGTLTFQTVILDVGARGLFGTLNAGILTASNSSIITHELTTASVLHKLTINATTVTLNSGTSIDVDARGFVKGTTSNGAGGITTLGAVGDRSGGSHGGRGGTDSVGDESIAPFDSISQPVDPGSGAGPQGAGGSGGGYVKIVTTSFTNDGTITANGGFAANGTGAGGGIWIIATGQVAGAGTVRVNGSSSNTTEGAGGGGRIALHYDSSQPGNDALSLVFQAFGGSNTASTDRRGGAGTVYLEKTNVHTLDQGNVTVANNNVSVTAIRNTVFPNNTVLADVIIKDNGVVQAQTFTAANLSLLTSGVIQHDFTTTSVINKLTITVTGTTTIDATGSINLDGRGFTTGRTSNGAGGISTTGASADRSGGSHGGRGGSDSVGDDSGVMYDNVLAPTDPGGGAGAGGSGGGYLKLTTGSFAHSGIITAAGVAASNRGGAGGGIWITTTGQVSGSGTIRANGANSASTTEGPGGGGRVAFYYDGAVSGNSSIGLIFQTFGGSNAGAPTDRVGGAGTVFIKNADQVNGDLRVDNTNLITNSARATRLFVTVPAGLPTTYTFRNLSVINRGQLLIDSPCAGTPALTVTGTTDLSGSGTITNNQSGTCTVSQIAINITTTLLPTATISQVYSQQIASTGGYGPHTFVCRSGGVTVACTTVLPSGLDMSSSGVVSGTPTITGTTNFTVRATEASPGVGTDEETISIAVGNAPTAPTNLFSNAIDAQSCCSSAITDVTPVFSAIFNDPDVGNTATKYQIQVASDAGFTTLLWNSSASGTSMASTAIGSRSPNINYAGSALTLGGVTYYWKIKFWDNTDIEGPFSATATFTTSTAPTAPDTLFSNDGSAQTGLTNPVGVTSGRPNFSAIYNDPDIGDIANKYRIQVDDNNDFSSVVWDSGAAGTSMTNCNDGARCADIAFGATAQLEADESVYFWRIKFFDQSGVESPWSQDPISTNKFTMGTGGSSQQRITDLQQQNQEQQDQESLPAAPQAVSVEVLGSTTLRYNWLDNSNNETGFRFLDANDVVIADVPSGTTSAQEINLAPNTQVTGRKVVAYNAVGQSSPSEFGGTVTSVPDVRPRLLGRTQHSVTFSIEPAFSSFPGETAIMYEILVTRPRLGVSQLRLSSEWIQTNEYTFEGIEADDEIEVRVTTRNQAAISSEPTVYEEMEDLSRRFAVTLGVFKKGTNTLPRPLAAIDSLEVSVQVQNVGSLAASNVLVSLPLPRYIVYRGGTLTVDGRGQSDGADRDAGQAGANAISAIWSQMAPNETHTLRFELAFDEAALNLLRPQPTSDANLAQAAANPIINLQVAVSFAESEDVYMSPVVSLEPDVTTSEPIVTPEPEPIPEEPVPLPTQEEVEQINELINQIIQQEVQENEGDAGTTPPASQEPEPTTVSSDGPSFNVEVTNEAGDSLSLTGLATANDDQIEFTGTTSQPFTLVTLIFNNSVTAIVVSDANGNWRTFVSADQLGIKPGQEASVKIEAIASKGDLRSERVQVGEVKISLGRSGDIEAEFDTTVSSNNVVTAINEVRKEVVRVIEEQQPVIQTTLSVTAPVVVVSSVPLWGYLPYIPTMIYHFLTYLLGLIGRKKKGQQRFYGVVYDSITKQPLPLAIVRIYSSLVIPNGSKGSLSQVRKLVSTTVTDKLGRYEALLAPGKYTLEVTKPTYQFPSQIVTTEVDANFHTYKAQDGMTIGEQGTEITVPDVPLDPVNAQRQWQLTGGVKKVWLAIQKVGNYLAVPVLLVGSIVSVVTVAAVPDKGVNWLLAIMYVLLLAAQLRLRPKLMKAWGVVYDIATNAVLPLTTIQLIDPQYGKVVTSRLSDYEGRFSFLPEPGNYVIKSSKPGYEQVKEVVESPQANRQPMKEQITVQKSEQVINGDLAMRLRG